MQLYPYEKDTNHDYVIQCLLVCLNCMSVFCVAKPWLLFAKCIERPKDHVGRAHYKLFISYCCKLCCIYVIESFVQIAIPLLLLANIIVSENFSFN